MGPLIFSGVTPMILFKMMYKFTCWNDWMHVLPRDNTLVLNRSHTFVHIIKYKNKILPAPFCISCRMAACFWCSHTSQSTLVVPCSQKPAVNQHLDTQISTLLYLPNYITNVLWNLWGKSIMDILLSEFVEDFVWEGEVALFCHNLSCVELQIIKIFVSQEQNLWRLVWS
jgi:hypothetical protein